MVPVTPPSATSQYSLFSNKNNRTHESTSGLNLLVILLLIYQ